MNYFIIGGDGKQYGPITDAVLGQWIAEGRLSAQSLAKAENDADFRPLADFPEFAGLFGENVAASYASSSANLSDWADRDYQLDIGGCLVRGWDLFKSNAGTLLGCLLVYAIIMFIVCGGINAILLAMIPKNLFDLAAFKIGYNIGYEFIVALIAGPLTGGFLYTFIQALRGNASVAYLFSGFQRAYSQLFLGQFIVSFLTGLCFIPLTFFESSKLEPVLKQLGQATAPDQFQTLMPQMWAGLASIFPLLFVCMIPMTYLMVSLQFALPLMIDKRMTVGDGIRNSFKMVHKHWWTIFGLVIVADLISVGGVLLCCVGVFLTVPIGTGALMAAYETIFGESRTA